MNLPSFLTYVQFYCNSSNILYTTGPEKSAPPYNFCNNFKS